MRLRIVLASLLICGVATAPAGATDILVNGSFDAASGSPWVQTTDHPEFPLIVSSFESPVTPHTGAKLVWHGGIADADMTLHQDVAVPAGQGKLTLTGQIQIRTSETGFVVYDVLYLELRGTNGALLETLATRNNTHANTSWSPLNLEATGDYAGQTVRLQARSSNDGSYETSFFLDTFALDASPTVGVLDQTPRATRLSMAGPNPSRETTRLRLELAAPSPARAWIGDLSGRVVRTLVDGPLAVGAHELTWDGADAAGGRAAPGVYFARVEVGGQTLSRTIVRIR